MKIALIILIVLGIALNATYIHLIDRIMRTRKHLLINKEDFKQYVLDNHYPLNDYTVELIMIAQEEYIMREKKNGCDL